MPEAGRSRVRFPMRPLDFFYLILPAALGSTQPVTEMSTRKTRNLLGGEGRPAGA
jgi:hypothetical protein